MTEQEQSAIDANPETNAHRAVNLEDAEMTVASVSALLTSIGALAIMLGGMLLMFSGFVPSVRGWAGRFILLGVVFAGAAALVRPGWLPS